jgi:hypothetical protein
MSEMSAEDYNALQAKPKLSKYGNVPTERDGVVFHSQAEADRYAQLVLLQIGGAITDLELQPAFPIIVNERRIAVYTADFAYTEVESGNWIIEDVKGGQTTPVFRLKKKLVEALYDVKIREVRMR